MAKSIVVTFPHELSVAEAKKRISDQVEVVKKTYIDRVGTGDIDWVGDTAHLRVSAVGQTTTAEIDVKPVEIRVEVHLPWLLAALANKIEQEAEFLAEHSETARAVVDFCKRTDREIKIATGNVLDLKMVLAIGVVGFTIFEVGATAATPVWVTLSLFGLNHFIEMQTEQLEAQAAGSGVPVKA